MMSEGCELAQISRHTARFMFIDVMKLWTFMAQSELMSSVSFGDKVFQNEAF